MKSPIAVLFPAPMDTVSEDVGAPVPVGLTQLLAGPVVLQLFATVHKLLEHPRQ